MKKYQSFWSVGEISSDIYLHDVKKILISLYVTCVMITCPKLTSISWYGTEINLSCTHRGKNLQMDEWSPSNCKFKSKYRILSVICKKANCISCFCGKANLFPFLRSVSFTSQFIGGSKRGTWLVPPLFGMGVPPAPGKSWICHVVFFHCYVENNLIH